KTTAGHAQTNERPELSGERDTDWLAAVAAAAGWRGHIWRNGELWKGGPLLRPDGTPRALRNPQHSINRTIRGELTWVEDANAWDGKDSSSSGFCYHLVGALWRAGCEVPQIIALAEALAPESRAKGDRWFHHVNLWGCLYRVKADGTPVGWARVLPDIPRR